MTKQGLRNKKEKENEKQKKKGAEKTTQLPCFSIS